MKRTIIRFGVIFTMIALMCSCSSDKLNENVKLQQTTEHFEFYSDDKDANVIEGLSKELEDSYSSISSHFKEYLSDKVEVIICPELKSFYEIIVKNERIDENEIPDWACAATYGNKIYMISPLNSEYSRNKANIPISARIVFDNLMLKKINKKMPYYLAEFVPRYEEELYDGVEAVVAQEYTNGTLPAIDKIIGISENDDYSMSYFTFVEFLLDEYGYDKVKELINRANIEKCIGKSKEEIEKDWLEYIKNTYISDFDLIKETEHFQIKYTEPDTDLAERAAQTLENRYAQVADSLNVNYDGKYKAIIYPTPQIFKKARLHDLPHSVKSNAITGYYHTSSDTVKVLSTHDPDSWSLDSRFDDLLVHEFTHSVIEKIKTDVPSYLNEGIATYMGQGTGTIEFRTTIVPMLRDNKFPSLEHITSIQQINQDWDIYQVGCSLVQYIVEQYGYQHLIEYIKNQDIQTVFGVSNDEFEANLITFLRGKYLSQ